MITENSDEKFFTDRGFGQSIGFGKNPAIIVIDMMNAFTDENLPLGTNQDLQIENINKLLSTARLKKIPIFFMATYYEEDDFSDAGIWFRKMKGLATLRKNTKETEIDGKIIRLKNEPIIAKRFASSFFGTDLLTRLNSKGIDTTIIVGCTTSGCVRATAVDAIQFGFIPIVVEEAVSDRSENAHKQSLFDLQAKYSDVQNIGQVLSKLDNL